MRICCSVYTMSGTVLASTGHDPNADVNLTARCGAGADLFFLGRKIHTLLADRVLAVVTFVVVRRDVPILAEGVTGTATLAQWHPHPGELTVAADVARRTEDHLLGGRHLVEQLVGRVVRTLMHPGSAVSHLRAPSSSLRGRS